jgi:anti-anti-sigma factor
MGTGLIIDAASERGDTVDCPDVGREAPAGSDCLLVRGALLVEGTAVNGDEVRGPVGGIAVRFEGCTSVVTLTGEIDGSLRDAASSCMLQVVLHGGPVVLDAGGVSFIDSTGLAFVLQLYRLSQESGFSFSLRNQAPVLVAMLTMIGMADQIPAEPLPVAAGR